MHQIAPFKKNLTRYMQISKNILAPPPLPNPGNTLRHPTIPGSPRAHKIPRTMSPDQCCQM